MAGHFAELGEIYIFSLTFKLRRLTPPEKSYDIIRCCYCSITNGGSLCIQNFNNSVSGFVSGVCLD